MYLHSKVARCRESRCVDLRENGPSSRVILRGTYYTRTWYMARQVVFRCTFRYCRPRQITCCLWGTVSSIVISLPRETLMYSQISQEVSRRLILLVAGQTQVLLPGGQRCEAGKTRDKVLWLSYGHLAGCDTKRILILTENQLELLGLQTSVSQAIGGASSNFTWSGLQRVSYSAFPSH